MTRLFEPLTLRGTTFRNRVWTAPMCQYSSVDGFPTDWHHTHLATRAVGGCGLVIAEATAVVPEGRISPQDAGIWSDAHVAAYQPITDAIARAGAVPGIQLAHAGRKASTWAPFVGEGSVPISEGGWESFAPSAQAYEGYATPTALTGAQIAAIVAAFATGATRAVDAGFQVIELHAAHGYLLHEFLSPLSNLRDDEYGGSLANRMRFPLEVVRAVRAALPDELPLLLRISATDWVDGGWDLASSVELSAKAAALGVDLVDVSSGGLDPRQQIQARPGYQVPFAAEIRAAAGVPTGAVGLITEPQQAEDIVASGEADAVLLARQLLREPYWPLRAAQTLGVDAPWPQQYERGAWHPKTLAAR